jgi:flavin reductase (DIM6/NTAB) family NADH-FMN oxidoreductase RutF
MAGSTGEPVGPFPEGADPVEYDKLRRRVLWKMPYGLYLVGSRSADGVNRNLMTLNWATQLSFDPKLVGIGVERTAITHRLIGDGRVFTLCLLDREDRTVVRKFAKPAEVDAQQRTLNGFAFRDGPSTGAPILEQSVAWLECLVRQEVECGNHTLFLGEVACCGFGEGSDAETPVLRMEDTRMNYGG